MAIQYWRPNVKIALEMEGWMARGEMDGGQGRIRGQRRRRRSPMVGRSPRGGEGRGRPRFGHRVHNESSLHLLPAVLMKLRSCQQ